MVFKGFRAIALCVAAIVAVPCAAQTAPSPTLAQRAAIAQRDAAGISALRDVRRLHIAYSQFAEVGLWSEMADLFADDAEMIVGDQTIRGKAPIARWIAATFGAGRPGLADGEIRTLLPFTPVVNLGADGLTAKARWHELAMTGAYGKEANWAGGIYENDYVKQGGIWKIARMHYYPQFAGTYEKGWRNVEPDLKVVPMHYTPDTAGIPLPEMASPAPISNPAVAARALDPALDGMLAENAVRNLQNIYGYYVDRRMWDDVADLFEMGGTLDIAGIGQWQGTASIRRGLEREGPAGIGANELNEHVQLPAIVTVSADGNEATARGLELAMTGQNDGKAYWSVSIFENRYRKRDGVWRIAAMNLFPRFRADYAEGWAKSRLDPLAPEQKQAPDAPSDFAKWAVPAFSYLHPVTGKPIVLAAGSGTGALIPGETRTAKVGAGSASALVAEAERKVQLLAADIGAENVSNAFGNYIDDFEWEQLGQIFARKGAREMPYAGFFIGPERISTAEITKWGHRKSPRTGIPIHLRIQPVIDVAPDGRSAKFRTRLFSISSGLEYAGSFSGGMYPNDQAVLEDGAWKLWSVAIDEFYYRSANYKDGWIKVPAEPAEKVPDMLLGAYPPDILLTELGQRQQGYIPGSKAFNPYVHNGPAYPGYPSATPMWFSYVNPVSGRVPDYYWPDCVTCAAHPETSLEANGY
ncbi:MAG: hypothetical protein BGO57_00035 [Sphingomonadales bacterium 63-6]|nr:MAG: hypothetical protein BGO57_00035 [Sphingomonadales bacterium 63-6]